MIKKNSSPQDDDNDELNTSNEELIMNDKRLRATVLPPKKNPIIRSDTEGNSDQVIKPLKISDRGSIFSVVTQQRKSREFVKN